MIELNESDNNMSMNINDNAGGIHNNEPQGINNNISEVKSQSP